MCSVRQKVVVGLLLCLSLVLDKSECRRFKAADVHMGIERPFADESSSKEGDWPNEDCGSSGTDSAVNVQSSCNTTWSFCDNGTCICAAVPMEVLRCDTRKNSSILSCNCITFDEARGVTEIGSCIYNCGSRCKHCNVFTRYTAIPLEAAELNERMCGVRFNRNGTLCGKCKDGYYSLAYSYNTSCVQCPGEKHNWWTFVLAAFLPLTIFYFVVVFFEVNITSSYFHGYVFYSQIFSMPTIIRMLYGDLNQPQDETALKWIVSLYGIWNLDFFRSANLNICLGTGTLETLALDLIVGVYPLLLMVLTYMLVELHDRRFRLVVIAWKPFRMLFGLFRRNWEIRTSLVDAFATFLLLSNVKFQSVCFDLLVPVVVHQLYSSGERNYTVRLYYDATVPYFGSRHLPYAVIAIMFFLIFVVLPSLLLALYPFHLFQKFLSWFPVRWCNVLHTFIDQFQGCYKDGTEPGTRDCRWFVSLFFFSRFLLTLIGGYTLSSMYYPLATVVLVLFAVLFLLVQPFKQSKSHLTYANVIFILLLAQWYVVGLVGVPRTVRRDPGLLRLYLVVACIVGTLPLLFTSAAVLHWICSHRKFGLELMRKLQFRRDGYSALE